jgi:hypothetical protein
MQLRSVTGWIQVKSNYRETSTDVPGKYGISLIGYRLKEGNAVYKRRASRGVFPVERKAITCVNERRR